MVIGDAYRSKIWPWDSTISRANNIFMTPGSKRPFEDDVLGGRYLIRRRVVALCEVMLEFRS